MKITVRQKTEVYEIDGQEISPPQTVHLGIDSHWNRNEFVVLVIDGHQYAVDGYQLQRAIINAMNTGM